MTDSQVFIVAVADSKDGRIEIMAYVVRQN